MLSIRYQNNAGNKIIIINFFFFSCLLIFVPVFLISCIKDCSKIVHAYFDSKDLVENGIDFFLSSF